jgi:hypothetical protein
MNEVGYHELLGWPLSAVWLAGGNTCVVAASCTERGLKTCSSRLSFAVGTRAPAHDSLSGRQLSVRDASCFDLEFSCACVQAKNMEALAAYGGVEGLAKLLGGSTHGLDDATVQTNL